MSKKNKGLIIFLLIVCVTSIGETILPFFPFIAIGCYCAYLLGKYDG